MSRQIGGFLMFHAWVTRAKAAHSTAARGNTQVFVPCNGVHSVAKSVVHCQPFTYTVSVPTSNVKCKPSLFLNHCTLYVVSLPAGPRTGSLPRHCGSCTPTCNASSKCSGPTS
mmetsp:Transcript_90854/g.180653  ORF Transcript_90854/g.180653 Transcript_90854/m.180653 type:complete len:113 (+) Transcript_90854:43-381(+)